MSGSTDRVGALAKADLRVSLRDGEQLLLTIALPILFLVFFSLVDIVPTGDGEPVNFLAPSIIALALISSSFVRLAISLGFDLSFGAVKRLAVTPLRVGEFLMAKAITTVIVFVGQLAILGVVAILLGWRPSPSIAFVAVVVLGMAAFVGLAFAITGVVDGLAALAAANALYVVLLLLSGIVFELDAFPGWLLTVVKLLPSTALAELSRTTLDGQTGPGWAWICLTAWAIAAPLVSARLFRWSTPA